MGYTYKRKLEDNISLILKQQKQMATSLKNISDKLDEVQSTLDAEQVAIKEIIDALKAIVADGGTEAERAAILAKAQALVTDVAGTV